MIITTVLVGIGIGEPVNISKTVCERERASLSSFIIERVQYDYVEDDDD